MKLECLRCFDEVAKTSSITKAAQNLYMTQPAISKMIRNLENDTGEVLLIRSPFGVKLTEQGEILWRFSQDVLQRYESYLEEKVACQQQSDTVVGVIELALAPLLLQTYYQVFTQNIKQAYPEVELRLIEANLEASQRLILNNEHAIALILYDRNLALPLNEKILAEEIYTSEIMICTSDKSNYGKRKSLAFYDVPFNKLISVDNAKNSVGLPNGDYNFYTTNLEIILQKILTDTDVCVTLPRFIVERKVQSAHIKAIPEQSHARSSVYLLYHKDALEKNIYTPYFINKFKDELVKCILS